MAIPVNPPTVSVVTIFLDEAEFLDEAIESVFAQTHQDWELVLVDDGSTDGSGAIADRWAARHPDRVRVARHPGGTNEGMSASRNLGVDVARGTYVSYLDGDDTWLPDHLEHHLDLHDRHPDLGFVFGPLRRWYSWSGQVDDFARDDRYGVTGPTISIPTDQIIEPPELLTAFLRDPDLIPAGATFRRALFHDVGGADPAFRGSYEDAVVMAKFALAARSYCTPKATYRYRLEDATTGRVGRPANDRRRSPLPYLTVVGDLIDRHSVDEPSLHRAYRIAQARATSTPTHRLRERTARIGRLARRAGFETARHANLARQRRLSRIPMDTICDELAFGYGPGGWSRYSDILTALERDADTDPRRSAFYAFYTDPIVTRAASFNDVLGLGDPTDPYGRLPQLWLGEYPWGGLAGPDPSTTTVAYGWAHDLAENVDTSEIWGRTRNLWHTPDDDMTLMAEWSRMRTLLPSIRRRYSPLTARAFPRVTRLEAADGRRRHVIVDGLHRLGCLSHLGVPTVWVELDATIRETEAATWPLVLNRTCTEAEARTFFHAFFELNGSERRERVTVADAASCT